MVNKNILSILPQLAIAIALAIAAVPPILFLVSEYRHEQAAVDIEAEINSRIIGQLINTNPELWTFETMRLEELLARRSARSENHEEIRSVFGPDKKLVAESRDDLRSPMITGSAVLFESGREAGRLEVSRSLRPLVNHALQVLFGSSLFGIGVFWVIRNIPLAALRRAFNELAEEKEKAQITLQSIGDAVITTDANMHIDYLNPIAENLTGWRTTEARGRHIDDVFNIYNEISRATVINPIKTCLEKNAIVEMENHTVLVRRSDQVEFHIEDSAAPIRRADGTVFGAVMVFHDVTERKAAQDQLEHIAFHDSLTGLPNRTLFRTQLSKALTAAQFLKQHVAVLFLDLDRFKTINDSLGHRVGDELLVLVAKRLKESLRDSDVVSRMGGDEFTAVLNNIEPGRASAVAEKIISSISKPYIVQGLELRVSTSIGITIYPDDGEDLDDLLMHADAAMYHAKSKGRNNYQYFDAAMSLKAGQELQVGSALSTALDNNEFFLVYQPKLNLDNNQIAGAEALLRWQNPQLGLVMPTDFIPRLEESGAITLVGNWALKTAIFQAKQWLDAGHAIQVAVNVSARQFKEGRLVEQIGTMLKQAELPPSLLQLEITESLLMEDAEGGEAVMRELIKIGVNVSLDDFGTGYSSLSHLRRFPISELKIDRSFVVDLGINTMAEKIIKTVIELGQALGMKVTAEGVETSEQRMHLQLLGCDEIQGYLLSRPLKADAFESFINHASTAPPIT